MVAAVRTRLALVALLCAVAAVAWWWMSRQMAGMDAGPWTSLGDLTWFVTVWIVMMAAMMFPSFAPTVALYAHVARRSTLEPTVFVLGYLVPWALAGLAAFGALDLGRHAWGDALAWNDAGRWIAAGTLAVAAVYQLSPLKDACLDRCRSPLGAVAGSWRGGAQGALYMGARNGAWCFGCCWALMASLFALGVMSLTWMAVAAALIAGEKLLPWRRVAVHGTAAVLAGLAVLMVASPGLIPGLTIPHGGMT